MEAERDIAGWRTWNEAKTVVRDREVWKDTDMALVRLLVSRD